MNLDERREARLSRRRECDRAHRSSESAEERETRLADKGPAIERDVPLSLISSSSPNEPQSATETGF